MVGSTRTVTSPQTCLAGPAWQRIDEFARMKINLLFVPTENILPDTWRKQRENLRAFLECCRLRFIEPVFGIRGC